jgi:hypothetical protein
MAHGSGDDKSFTGTRKPPYRLILGR